MAQSSPVRILIVDDSAVMRSLLRSVVSTDARLEVVGTAIDGASALRVLDTLRPDLILLDVEMPGMDGLATLKQMKAKGLRIPVIMCSSVTQRGAQVTIEALASGASDYVAKPAGQPSRDAAIETLARDLIPKILAFSGSVLAHGGSAHPTPTPINYRDQLNYRDQRPTSMLSPLSQPRRQPPIPANPAIVLIGVSTGGPAALEILLPQLPRSFPLPILIVQHMPAVFTKMLAERLDARCPLHITEAAEGAPILPGTIHIGRGDWHLSLQAGPQSSSPFASPPSIHLSQEPPENHCRPAVDFLFRSAVRTYGSRILAVVLTGMGSDGLEGSRLIRQHGGGVLAQDQQTSAVWGMPGAVTQAGLAHKVLPLQDLATEILRLSVRSQREASELRESAV